MLAVSAAYLDLAVEAALDATGCGASSSSTTARNPMTHRDGLEQAQRRLRQAGMSTVVDTLADDAARGATLPAEPLYTAGNDERLAMIFYTSGSTGTPKGAMYTEAMVSQVVDAIVHVAVRDCRSSTSTSCR